MTAVISAELESLLRQHRRYLKMQLPAAVGLTLDEIQTLVEAGCFPAARCHELFGPSWNAVKVDAWSWGLRNSARIAVQVEMVLGYRNDDWAATS